jgi:hypothetical protein
VNQEQEWLLVQEQEWLLVNDIRFEENTMLVGATNRERWTWEQELGQSGVDAATLVCVILTDHGPGYAVSEEVALHCHRSDPLRRLVLEAIGPLFEIAWKIKDDRLDREHARNVFFGYKIRTQNLGSVDI